MCVGTVTIKGRGKRERLFRSLNRTERKEVAFRKKALLNRLGVLYWKSLHYQNSLNHFLKDPRISDLSEKI